MIVSSIEIDRPQEDVFEYLDELDKHSEWQRDLISSRLETEGPIRVGTRAAATRKVPGGPREMIYESLNTTRRIRARGAFWTVRCEPSDR